MNLSTTFKDLAQPPAKNFTLGEVLAKRQGWVINTNPLNFTTAGRAIERVNTASGVLSALFVTVAATAASAPVVPVLAVAAGILGCHKVMGIAAGKLVDMGVRRAAQLG